MRFSSGLAVFVTSVALVLAFPSAAQIIGGGIWKAAPSGGGSVTFGGYFDAVTLGTNTDMTFPTGSATVGAQICVATALSSSGSLPIVLKGSGVTLTDVSGALSDTVTFNHLECGTLGSADVTGVNSGKLTVTTTLDAGHNFVGEIINGATGVGVYAFAFGSNTVVSYSSVTPTAGHSKGFASLMWSYQGSTTGISCTPGTWTARLNYDKPGSYAQYVFDAIGASSPAGAAVTCQTANGTGGFEGFEVEVTG